MCRTFGSTGSCPYGYKCLFAHGAEELRTVSDNEMLQVQGASPRQVPNYGTSIYSKTANGMLGTPLTTPQQSSNRAYSVMSQQQQQHTLPTRQLNQSLVAQSARRSRAFFPVDGISPRHLLSARSGVNSSPMASATSARSAPSNQPQQQLPARSNTVYLLPSNRSFTSASAAASPMSSRRSITPSQAMLTLMAPSPRKWASTSDMGTDEPADSPMASQTPSVNVSTGERKASVNESLVAKTPQALERAKKLYKTEVCRSWQDYQMCPYGAKCQFAHGDAELRQVERHRKYKTKKCKKFHSEGVCPFGSRCIFIHEEDERELPNSPRFDPAFAAQMRQRRASATPVRHLSPSLNAMSPLMSPAAAGRSSMNAISLGGAASPSLSQKQTRNSISGYTKRFSRFGDEHSSAVDDFIKRRMTDASIDSSVARLGTLGNGIAGLSLKDMGKTEAPSVSPSSATETTSTTTNKPAVAATTEPAVTATTA